MYTCLACAAVFGEAVISGESSGGQDRSRRHLRHQVRRGYTEGYRRGYTEVQARLHASTWRQPHE